MGKFGTIDICGCQTKRQADTTAPRLSLQYYFCNGIHPHSTVELT